MPAETLVNRVAILEHKMLSLEGLPDRVASLEGQISQFRAEVRVEFSAVREEMRAGDAETRRHMRVLHEQVIARIGLLDEHLHGRKRSPDSRGRTGHSRRRLKR
jgi:hypothetical protein